MKKRVYQVGPSKSLRGGISTVIRDITNSDILNEKYEIVDIESVNKNKLKTFLKAILKVKNIKSDEIIHFHVASNGSFIRKFILFKIANKNTKKIMHIHGGGFVDYYKTSNAITKNCIEEMINNCDEIVTVSKYMADNLESKIPMIKGKVKVIYNGVNLKEIDINKLNKENIILFMGKVVDYKGAFDVVNITKDISKNLREKNFKVIMAGDGEIDKLKNIIKENDLEDLISVVGWIDGEEKERLLAKSKIFIMPSKIESFGISAVEAMNYGNVVVCSDKGGLPEIIKEENGFVVSDNSLETFSSILSELIYNNNLIEVISKSNIKYSRRFSVEDMSINIIYLYGNLNNSKEGIL